MKYRWMKKNADAEFRIWNVTTRDVWKFLVYVVH